MKIKALTSLAALTLIGLWIGSTSTGSSAKNEVPQDRPANDIAFEEAQTAKLLGVPLQKFPAPQGLNGMDEIPASATQFKFTLKAQPPSGRPPRVYFETRKIVQAAAPDGSIYEAYCGHEDDDPRQIAPGHGLVSTYENRRQWYENHFGYGYMPQDVFIGKRKAGLIKATLFFRDVGSHTTSPHALAIDSRGLVHLAVADVNISQGNRLDMYWVIGDPQTGKWNAAWLIDRRGFTSPLSHGVGRGVTKFICFGTGPTQAFIRTRRVWVRTTSNGQPADLEERHESSRVPSAKWRRPSIQNPVCW